VTSLSALTPVHLVVPSNIDDPGQPSGGNRYDRRVSDTLRAAGVGVCEHAIGGALKALRDVAMVSGQMACVNDRA